MSVSELLDYVQCPYTFNLSYRIICITELFVMALHLQLQ